MICSKCGAQLPDDSKFCGTCGNNLAAQNETPVQAQPETTETTNEETPVTEAAPAVEPAPATEPVSEQPVYNPTPQPDFGFNGGNQPPVNNYQQADTDASKKGLIMLAGIAVVAIIVIVLLFSLIFGGGGWKDVIKDRVKYYNKQSTDVKDYYYANYGEVCGEFNYEQAKLIAELTDEEDWEEDFEDTIEDTYEYFEDSFGDDWKMDYEIKSKKSMSDSKLDDAQESWEDEIETIENILDTLDDIDDPEDYNDELDDDDVEELIKFYEKWLKKFEKMEVKKGYKVKTELIIEGDDDDSEETTTINVIKLGGTWTTDEFYIEYPDLFW